MLAPTALPRERFSPLAQSARASLRDRMSAFGSGAEDIAHSMAVDRVANFSAKSALTRRQPVRPRMSGYRLLRKSAPRFVAWHQTPLTQSGSWGDRIRV